MNRHINAISNRLSLRQPQRDSLEILARVCEIIELDKGADVSKQLEVIKSEFPTVTDFERDFPSLCFALATGVGKTRLMGAFITYLYRAEGGTPLLRSRAESNHLQQAHRRFYAEHAKVRLSGNC